uniref:PRC-barrel domain-containing protein n=1 Tax=uncultured Nocardioides sp. TaxID=198441 RepID=UPI002618C166
PRHREELAWIADGDHLLAHPADDVRGLAVVDPSGYRVGEVIELAIDTDERRARLLTVASGGFLGLAASEQWIPVEVVTRVDDRVHVDRHHGTVRAIQHGGSHPVARSDVAAVYEHFGVQPFWTVDRAPSYFHTRQQATSAPVRAEH